MDNRSLKRMGRPYAAWKNMIAAGVMLSLFWCSSPGHAADIELDDRHANKGETVVFTLSVNNAPRDLQAFMLDVVYDFTVLGFAGFAPGELADGKYSLFNVLNRAPGVIRIGAVEPQDPGIKKGASGAIVRLSFNVLKEEQCTLALTSLANDIEGFTTKDGRFLGAAKGQEETAGEQETAGEEGATTVDPFSGFGSPETGPQGTGETSQTPPGGGLTAGSGQKEATSVSKAGSINTDQGVTGAAKGRAVAGMEEETPAAGESTPTSPSVVKQVLPLKPKEAAPLLKPGRKQPTSPALPVSGKRIGKEDSGMGSPLGIIIQGAGMVLQAAILLLLVMILAKLKGIEATLRSVESGKQPQPGNREKKSNIKKETIKNGEKRA